MKRYLLFCAALALFCGSAQAALTYEDTYYRKNLQYALTGSDRDPIRLFINEVETAIEAFALEGGVYITMPTNGMIIDNSQEDGRLEFRDNSETFGFKIGSNKVELITDSGVSVIDFNDVHTFIDVNSITIDSPGFIRLTAHDTTPGAVAGTLYYDLSDNKFYGRNNSAWVDLGASASGVANLDQAYDGGGSGAGKAVTVDAGAVALTATDAANNTVLVITQQDTAASTSVQIVSSATTANTPALDIDAQAAGRDIEGTGATWYVSGAGAMTVVSLTTSGAAGVVLQNGETITNATDTEIKFASDTENFSIDFVNNEIDFKTTSDVATVGWGDLDDHTGLNNLTFDAAASMITLPSSGDAQDLTVRVTGATNSSLFLTSTGTGADAVRVNASAGAIDIDAANGIAVDVAGATGEDFVLTNTGGSIILEATEGVEDAVVIKATTPAGGIDITSQADIDISTTGADGEDITLLNTGGSIVLDASEAAADAIKIDARTDAGGGIAVDFGSGNMTVVGNGASADFTLDCDLFSIDGTGVANVSVTANGAGEDFTVAQAGGVDASLILTSAGTGADALQLSASNAAGGITVGYGTGNMVITGTGASADFTLDCDLFSIDGTGAANLSVTGAEGEDLTISQLGAADASLILSSAGTGADAIKINASDAAGGLDVDAGTNGIDILATGGAVAIGTTKNAAAAIGLTTNGGTGETIYLHNTLGNTAAAINLYAQAGGITLNAVSGGVVFTTGQTRKVLIPVSTVTLDGTNPPSLTTNGTDAQWKAPSLEFDADGGITGDDLCYIHWVVPDGYKADTAKLNVYWSHDTAEDADDEASLDFTVSAVAAGETLDAAGTAGDAVSTVIADASQSAGKLQKTQINIEIVDIAVGDMVSILFFVDESGSALAASGTLDVHYFEIEWESTE